MDGPASNGTAHLDDAEKTKVPLATDVEVGDYALDKIHQAVHRGADDPERAAAEKRYMRRLNSIILPTISLLYFFEYLDRGNVAVSDCLDNDLICPPHWARSQLTWPRTEREALRPRFRPRHGRQWRRAGQDIAELDRMEPDRDDLLCRPGSVPGARLHRISCLFAVQGC